MNVCKNEIMDAIEAELEAISRNFTEVDEACVTANIAFKEAKKTFSECQMLSSELCKHVNYGSIQDKLVTVTRLKYAEIRLAELAVEATAMAIKAEQSIADKMDLEGWNDAEKDNQ